MPKRHDQFVHDQNIANFKRQLGTENDPGRIALLETLLREEKARPDVKPLPGKAGQMPD